MAETNPAPKAGPVVNDTVEEVQGIFPSDAALQEALSKLTMAGFDRADFSLPETRPAPGHATPEGAAANPDTDVDNRQMRTMHASMAGSAAAMAAAGIVIATGGAAAPAVAAAAAAGAAGGLGANAASTAADRAQHDEREQAARDGRLVLSVHAADPARRQQAEALMREAGATRVEAVRRTGSGVSSASWTG